MPRARLRMNSRAVTIHRKSCSPCEAFHPHCLVIIMRPFHSEFSLSFLAGRPIIAILIRCVLRARHRRYSGSPTGNRQANKSSPPVCNLSEPAFPELRDSPAIPHSAAGSAHKGIPSGAKMSGGCPTKPARCERANKPHGTDRPGELCQEKPKSSNGRAGSWNARVYGWGDKSKASSSSCRDCSRISNSDERWRGHHRGPINSIAIGRFLI